MITAGNTICSHPFSQVVKKITDPEGDQLAFKAHAGMRWRYFPPFPLLASPSDAEEATMSLLPSKAREACRLEKAGNLKDALTNFTEALRQAPDNNRLYSLAVQCAWQVQDWPQVEQWSRDALKLSPNHPVLNHNLAVLYSNSPEGLKEAIDLLETALKFAPNYSRAHLTLASCYMDIGELGKAFDHARWVHENDPQLKEEADRLLKELRKDPK